RRDLFAYFERCADVYGVRPRIRFATEVRSARFDEEGGRWEGRGGTPGGRGEVRLRTPAGGEERLAVSAIVSAVGQLNRPKIPEIPGLDRFAGSWFHSAAWQHQHDLTGLRVAVIGTGASAFQLVPEVAKRASQLTVFQRSPAWMLPNPVYHAAVRATKKWLR